MPLNKGSSFCRPLFAALDATFPLQYRPSRKVILRELGKYRTEINLPVSRRAKPPRTIHPALITSVNALPARRTKLRILHVKHFNALVVHLDEFQIIELLQHEMAWVIQHVASLMIARTLQKHFKSGPIMQIFTGMNLKAQIHSRLIKCIQDGTPPRRQLVKGSFNQPCRS